MAATAEDWSFDDNEELLDQRYDDGIEGTYEEEADNYLNLRKPASEKLANIKTSKLFAHRHYSALPTRPVCNKLLAMRWESKARELHRRNLSQAKPSIDNSPPRAFHHLESREKKLQLEEERILDIQRKNEILLKRIAFQMTKPTSLSPQVAAQRRNCAAGVILRTNPRKQSDLQKIEEQNEVYLQRLEDKGANYNRQEWERDRINKLIYLANISQWPETYVEALKKMGIDPFHRNRPASASSTAAAATNPPATKLSASSLAREKTPSSTALRSQSLARPRSARPPLKTSKPVRIRPKTAIGSSGSRSYQSTATASWTSSGSLSNANQSNAKDFIFNQPRTPDERARSRRPQTAGPSRSRSANPKLAIAEKPLRPQSASAAGRAYAKNLVVTSTSAPQTPLSVTRPASAHARPTTATAASRGIASKPPAVAPTTTTTLQHNSSLFSQFTDDDSLFNDKGKLTDKHHHHQNNPLSSSQSSINNRVRFEEAETPSTHPSLSRNSSFNTANTPAAPTPATHSYTKKPHSLTKTATEDDIDNFYKDDFFNDVTPAKKEAVVASVAPGESVDKDDMGSPSKNVVQMLETFMTISNNHENAENKQQELNTIASNIVKRVVSESENLADVVLDPHEAKMLVDLIVENEKTTPASSSSVNAAQFEPSLRELITDVVNRKVAQGATVTNKMGSKENLKNSISNLEASLDKQSVPKLPEKENSSSFFSGVRRSIRSLRSTNSSRTGSTTNISSK